MNPSYRDRYDGPRSETTAAVHGPYRLEAISADSFVEVSAVEANDVLRAWLDGFKTQPSPRAAPGIEVVHQLIEAGTRCFQLINPGLDARHDLGWLVGKDGFHELVVLGPGKAVILVVAADD